MPHDAAFHLGLHCLLKYPFRGFRSLKGERYFVRISMNVYTVKSKCNLTPNLVAAELSLGLVKLL